MENVVFRNELKFLISNESAYILKSRMKLLLQADKNEASESGYFIRSLYFDDAAFSSYFDKMSGVPERTKYRIRFYNLSDDYICIEKKEKTSDKIRKTSYRISKIQLNALLSGYFGFFDHSDNELLSEFIMKLKYEGYHPAAVVDYQRKTYYSPFSDLRITFDSSLFASPYTDGCLFSRSNAAIPVSDGVNNLLEIKYNDFILPQIEDAIRDIPKVKFANSKYCKCCEALYWSMR